MAPELPAADRTWADWEAVGGDFARLPSLSEAQQQALHGGQTVQTEVVLRDGMLWGSVFRFEPALSALELAAVFYDFAGQRRFVPGMPVTRVVARDGKRSRVYHRINPVVFFWPGAQRLWPPWLFGLLTYAYELDEEVFEHDDGHSIRWTIPLAEQVLGGRENGEILFTEHRCGVLISYNNATAPFGYPQLKRLLPGRVVSWLVGSMGSVAQAYYRRTVEGFVALVDRLDAEERAAAVAAMTEHLREPPPTG